jgi:hypothetical protein
MLNFGHTIKSHKLELKSKTDIKIKSYFTIQVVRQSYCNKFAGSVSQWMFNALKNQYTTVDYSSQLF